MGGSGAGAGALQLQGGQVADAPPSRSRSSGKGSDSPRHGAVNATAAAQGGVDKARPRTPLGASTQAGPTGTGVQGKADKRQGVQQQGPRAHQESTRSSGAGALTGPPRHLPGPGYSDLPRAPQPPARRQPNSTHAGGGGCRSSGYRDQQGTTKCSLPQFGDWGVEDDGGMQSFSQMFSDLRAKKNELLQPGHTFIMPSLNEGAEAPKEGEGNPSGMPAAGATAGGASGVPGGMKERPGTAGPPGAAKAVRPRSSGGSGGSLGCVRCTRASRWRRAVLER